VRTHPVFDFKGGRDGTRTIGVPVVVVTHRLPTEWVEAHPDASFHFVTDGVAAAIAKAQEIAGEGTVAVTAGTIARQCLDLGLLDSVAGDLVPVVMGQDRPLLQRDDDRRCFSGRPDRVCRGRARHSPHLPCDGVIDANFGAARITTLHVGLRVEDLERSLGFYENLGYDVVGTVPETELGTLTMLALPGDEFVALELVHDPAHGRVEPSDLSHVVIQVEDMHATVAYLATQGVAEEPGSPNGSADFWTAWVTDPDGSRIELVQWPDGMNGSQSAAQGTWSSNCFDAMGRPTTLSWRLAEDNAPAVDSCDARFRACRSTAGMLFGLWSGSQESRHPAPQQSSLVAARRDHQRTRRRRTTTRRSNPRPPRRPTHHRALRPRPRQPRPPRRPLPHRPRRGGLTPCQCSVDAAPTSRPVPDPEPRPAEARVVCRCGVGG
jgi:lactoylglutathione lyase